MVTLNKTDIAVLVIFSTMTIAYAIALVFLGSSGKRVSTLFFLGIIGCVIAFSGTFTFVTPAPTPYGSPSYVSFHNPSSSGIVMAELAIPSSSGETEILSQGQSFFSIPMSYGDVISAQGKTAWGSSILLNYTHTIIGNSDVYYTPSGSIPSYAFAPYFNVFNQSATTAIIYSRDESGSSYQAYSVPSGSSASGIGWMGQSFATNPQMTGAIVSQAYQTVLTVETDGSLTIA